MWALIYKADVGEYKASDIHLVGMGSFDPSNHNMDLLEYIEIPNQPTAHLYEDGEMVGALSGLVLYTDEEKAQLVDRDTGRAIDEAVHPFAGLEEQIGILRAQIGAILNEIGLEPNSDFDQLNNIVTEKIQEGQKKKEAL